jgi:hypothetical protein
MKSFEIKMYYHSGAIMPVGQEPDRSQEKVKIRMKTSFILFNPTLKPSKEQRK